MATVWVVEQGEYSDYRVVGVFTSRENAERIAEAINRAGYSTDAASVSEWPLDPAVTELAQGRRPFIVHMRRDGRIERCDPWEIDSSTIYSSFTIWRRSEAPAYLGQTDKPDLLNATAWATDAEHAIKIVNEKRAQMIANGEWPEKAA